MWALSKGVFGPHLCSWRSWAVCFWLLSDPAARPAGRPPFAACPWLCGALFSSLAVLCLHGVVEDPLYGSRALLMLLAPGWAGGRDISAPPRFCP